MLIYVIDSHDKHKKETLLTYLFSYLSINCVLLIQLMSGEESKKWFEEVIPALANLLLRFPSLLEEHYRSTDMVVDGEIGGGLRLLESQEAGIIFLSQVSLCNILYICI